MRKKGVSVDYLQSASNIERAFDDEEVLDENDEIQRQHRIESLQNQSLFWKNCLDKQSGRETSIWRNNVFKECRNQAGDSSPEEFKRYFNKYNGLSAKLLVNKTGNDSKSSSMVQDVDKKQISSSKIESRKGRANTLNNSNRKFPNQKDSMQGEEGISSRWFEEDDLPTPCDEEEHSLAENMKFHSLQKPKQSEIQSVISKNQSAPNESKKPAPSSSVSKAAVHSIPKYVSQFIDTPENEDTPEGYLDSVEPNQELDMQRKAFIEQQEFLKKQAEQLQQQPMGMMISDEMQQQQQQQQSNSKLQQQKQQPQQEQSQQMQQPIPKPNKPQRLQNQSISGIIQNNSNLASQPPQNQAQKPPSIPSMREILEKNNTEGYEEITSAQKDYFESPNFKKLLNQEILPDLSPARDTLDNEHFLICLKDQKWNRIYLKDLHMYVQLRVFQSKQTFTLYIDSYQKIVSKFIKYMPQTVYSDEGGLIIIQKLGDFSLYDLSNLIFIEAKTHDKMNYQKYYMQMLSNLFDSLILILSNNYYIGNIASKNIFVSMVPNSQPRSFIVKFSNLVDFSFNYNDIVDTMYACAFKHKPTETEIWFSELFACCRCMQEMMERDRYYFEKKNIKEFINKYKQKYPRLINVLSYFLIRQEMIKDSVNFDIISQFVVSSFESDSEKVIQLSDKSVKHIQLMIQTSKLHFTPETYNLTDKRVEQRTYFFLQQLNFHQDLDDPEIKYLMKYVNRMFYCHLLAKPTESDLIYAMLEALLSDAMIFRRDKNIQKSTYMINVLYHLKNPAKIDKSITYWRYLNQTTSLVEVQNPVSLYYIGLLNMYLLDLPKSSKYFAHSYDSKDYCEDIICVENSGKNQRNPRQPAFELPNYYDEYDMDDAYDVPRFKELDGPSLSGQFRNNKSKIIPSKKKSSHWLFTSPSYSDKYVILVREAYGYLGQLKFVFMQENSIKRLAEIITESKRYRVYKMVVRLIAFEISLTSNLKTFILERHKVREPIFFIDQISGGSNFSEANFAMTAKAIANQITLIENLKRQITGGYTQEPLFQQIVSLFLAQTEMQAIIIEFVSREKRILNHSSDKQQARNFNYFPNLDI